MGWPLALSRTFSIFAITLATGQNQIFNYQKKGDLFP